MKVQGLLSEVLLSTQTDERLCALVSSGHPSAFAVLADRHRAALLRTAARVGGQDGAEDVVQDALLQAWKGLTDGVEVRHARAWLHQIVRHTAINHGRRRVGVEPLGDELASPQVIADQLANRDLARSVLAEIAALPERQREALIATEFGDRSRSEIAAELGVSEGAVRQLVHRARDSLRLAFSALIPYPLIAWFLRPRSGFAERLARALAPANRSDLVQNVLTAPRGGGVLLRGGAVLLAAGAAGTVVIPRLAAQGPAQHAVTQQQQQPAPGGASQGLRAGKPSLLGNGAGPLAPGSRGKAGASVPLLPGLEPEAAARVHEDVGTKRSRADAVELAAQTPERAAATESSQTQEARSGDANGSDGASTLTSTTAVTSGDSQAGSSSAGSTDQTTATSPATAGSGSGDTSTVSTQPSTSSGTSGGDGAAAQGSSSQQGTDTTSSSDN